MAALDGGLSRRLMIVQSAAIETVPADGLFVDCVNRAQH
jgi:hypothetical protein